jgi:hypothetical protein
VSRVLSAPSGWFVAVVSVCKVLFESVVLLDVDCGCAHGGVGSVTGVSVGGCCVASAGLTCPLLALFLPAMTVAG